MNCLRFSIPITIRRVQVVQRLDNLSRDLSPLFTSHATDGWSLLSLGSGRRCLESHASGRGSSLLSGGSSYQCRTNGWSSAAGDKGSAAVKTPKTKSKKQSPEESSEAKDRSEVKVKDKSNVKVRQLTLRSNIASHDFDVKMTHVCDWLNKGNEVRVTVVKGSGSARQEGLNTSLFDKVLQATQDVAIVRLANKTESDLVISLTSKKSPETPHHADKSEKVPKPYTAAELKQMRDGKVKSKDDPVKTDTN